MVRMKKETARMCTRTKETKTKSEGTALEVKMVDERREAIINN
jgi:hypothetical protein